MERGRGGTGTAMSTHPGTVDGSLPRLGPARDSVQPRQSARPSHYRSEGGNRRILPCVDGEGGLAQDCCSRAAYLVEKGPRPLDSGVVAGRVDYLEAAGGGGSSAEVVAGGSAAANASVGEGRSRKHSPDFRLEIPIGNGHGVASHDVTHGLCARVATDKRARVFTSRLLQDRPHGTIPPVAVAVIHGHGDTHAVASHAPA